MVICFYYIEGLELTKKIPNYGIFFCFCIRVIKSFYIDNVESLACSSPAFYLYESHIHKSLISRKLNRFHTKKDKLLFTNYDKYLMFFEIKPYFMTNI